MGGRGSIIKKESVIFNESCQFLVEVGVVGAAESAIGGDEDDGGLATLLGLEEGMVLGKGFLGQGDEHVPSALDIVSSFQDRADGVLHLD